MEHLELGNREFLETREYNSKISFLGATYKFDARLSASIKSINEIAKELGNDYEIIIANISGSPVAKEIRREYSYSIPDLQIVEGQKGNFGSGKKIAYKNSEGKYIVPFCTNISYPVEYADLIHGFLKMRIKRLFYSELSLLNREFIDQVGGWRDLTNGEDIDLFSRLTVNYGVFAFPTSLMKLSDMEKNEVLSIRFRDGDYFRSNYHLGLLRDLIISCNYSISDIKELRKLERILSRDYTRGSLIAYIMSKFAATKPTRYSKNNFLILFEGILESMVLREYLKISELPVEATLELDQVHLAYLKSKSKLFNDLKSSASKLFVA